MFCLLPHIANGFNGHLTHFLNFYGFLRIEVLVALPFRWLKAAMSNLLVANFREFTIYFMWILKTSCYKTPLFHLKPFRTLDS